MFSVSGVGVVEVAYSHFSVGEAPEPGFERIEGKVDFGTEDPVIMAPGEIVIVSRVQEHLVPVTLAVVKEGEHALPTGPGDEWMLVGAGVFRPIYAGLMRVSGPTTGLAVPAVAPARLYGLDVEPGEPSITLDPAVVYEVKVYAQGWEDSAERFDAAMEREEWGAGEGFEAYAVVFRPDGTQQPPVRSVENPRERLARERGRRPANLTDRP